MALASLYTGFDDLAVAGRTDAGVHALGQVASVQVSGGPPSEKAAEALKVTGPGRVAIPAVNAPDLQKEAAKR